MLHRLIVAGAVALALLGCMSTGTKVTEGDLAQFSKGVTTEDQVVARLGKPNGRSVTSNGMRVIIYSYAHGSAFGANGNAVSLIFDANGVLQSYSASESNTSVRPAL